MNGRTGRVVVIGSANLDLVVRVSRPPSVGETLLGDAVGRFAGGKGLNQAIAAARCGATVALCGAVGDDDAARSLRTALVDAGVEPMLSISSDRPTGVAHILAMPDGDNAIVVAAGANGTVTPEDAASAVAGAAVVLAQLEVPVDAVAAGVAAARAAGALTVLNAAPATVEVIPLLASVDVLVVNGTECDDLGGVASLLAAGADCVIVTRGGDGVDVHRAGAASISVPALVVDVVDTTGAGDAFCGALVAALAAGRSIDDAVVHGITAGAVAVQRLGASLTAADGETIGRMLADVPR